MGADSDTWMASPYAPTGIATPVEGGYLFSGRWQFSSGTDHCDWIFLGAMLGDKTGGMALPPKMLHMILPRSDYSSSRGRTRAASAGNFQVRPRIWRSVVERVSVFGADEG